MTWTIGQKWTRTTELIEAACRIVDRDLTEQERTQCVGDAVAYRARCTAA